MTTDNRAAMWPLPPIALQILHYLDDADDALAFLSAAPYDSLDDALDALRTLLAFDSEFSLWPTADIASLEAAYNVSPSVVAKALPLLKKIDLGFCKHHWSICHATELPPTTAVIASVDLDVISVPTVLGKWLPNLVDLKVTNLSSLDFAAIVQDSLSVCRGLITLTMNQEEMLNQGTFDAALIAIAAYCPQVERISVGSSSVSLMSDCETLLAWLALPTARHLELECTKFAWELGKELATVMLTSSTLETLELTGVSSLMRAILSPSSPPLPPQLRHLAIWELYSMENEYDDTLCPFDQSDAAALAAKIATSHLESLELGSQYPSDVAAVIPVLQQLPTLTKLSLHGVVLSAFAPLRQLLHLEINEATFTDEAIKCLAVLLGSSPKLVHLDLGWDSLYQNFPPDHQVEMILSALPHWLSHRGTTCNVSLPIMTEASAAALIAALAKTRNSHRVTCLIATSGLSLHYKKQLVAALASTSRMALCILGADRFEFVALEAYGRQHQLTIAYRKESTTAAKECWFHSPRR
ncbi:hypothetical protein SPRG_09322 [Saprolegnia parasitica CBS 223.65]|uniref:F-box domain-containing protein n=1 Tax=Saprolegnia parasitica (strain CBS 223.65) TaxID=695850 RepID=A0A067CFQ4_SAPPC|nr:hypothetical protein SPRG_09322 [Saprolegnia parasitica CBS 223.65]KDO25381.1 hypothetical protein SPRG_09322 [Saprolegnia parasitica CBS 223.65]|eukprot:XP_012203809.1 hypothetical protein SPRG_09322 [Saprolegnia parasitica CBS 223.65]